jgi:hypothetical protein
MGPRTGLDYVEKRKFLTLPGLELRRVCRPARLYTDDVKVAAIKGNARYLCFSRYCSQRRCHQQVPACFLLLLTVRT